MVMVEYNIPNALLSSSPYFRNSLLYNLYSLLRLPCHHPFLQIQNHLVHPKSRSIASPATPPPSSPSLRPEDATIPHGTSSSPTSYILKHGGILQHVR